MKKIKIYRINNYYFLISLIALLFCLGISWFFESTYAEIMFFMDYDAPDLIGFTKDEVRNILLEGILCWEIYIDSAMRYIVHIFPIFAVIPTIPFMRERKSYFVFGAVRFKNYKQSLIHALLIYILEGGLCISLAFVIFFTIGNFFMIPSLYNISGFASILPEGFYASHPYLFFIFMSTTIYFVIGCAFAGLSCAIAFFTQKEYYILLIPILIYMIEYYIAGIFDIHLFQIPVSVIAFNTSYSTLETFIPLIPLGILDILLILLGLKRRKKGIVS